MDDTSGNTVGIGASKFTFDTRAIGGINATLGATAPLFWVVLGGYLVDGVTPDAAVDQTFRTLNEALTTTVTRKIQTYVGNVAA